MVTYNFFCVDNQYFIIINGQPIQVCKTIFDAYKSGVYATFNSDMKYYANNESLFLESYKQALNAYAYISADPEEQFMQLESDNEFFSHFTENERSVILHLLDGYKECEIAESLRVSQQYVNKMKKSIRKKLS